MAQRTREAEVMDLAIDLYAQALRHEEQDTRDKSLAVAAGEVGVPPEFVEKAVAMVEQRRAAELAKGARNKRVGVYAAAAVLVVGLVGAVLFRPAPAPVVESFTEAGARWHLDSNPESRATLTAGGESVRIRVDGFGAQADGKYHVNLDRQVELAPLDRHSQATLRVRGQGLGVVRLYLEGDGVRWRSAPVPVSAEWQSHTLELDSFERQERGGDGFRVVGRGDVHDVRGWSLKLGHYMNPVDATGEVEIDELRFE
jgi:hypothetical protein